MDKDEELRKVLTPELRRSEMLVNDLEGSYIFRNGVWWKIEYVGVAWARLREVTNREMVDVIVRHPGIPVLLGGEKKMSNFEDWIAEHFDCVEPQEGEHPQIKEIFDAIEAVKSVSEFHTHVYIPDVYAYLVNNGLLVPTSVVYYTLKVAEHFGESLDIGEGFFSLLF